MKNLNEIVLAVALVGAAACGDNATNNSPDAPSFPAAPTLGRAIDRMGRPAINTALNAVLDADGLKKTKKDNYNNALSQDNWSSVQLDPSKPEDTILAEFKTYLAVYDALDTGIAAIANAGCGNAQDYNDFATTLADDELYVDTALGRCDFYLGVEARTLLPPSWCGGRTLDRDVIDASYSLLAAGNSGFDLSTLPALPPAPKIKDGAEPHTDYKADFPYLGDAHL